MGLLVASVLWIVSCDLDLRSRLAISTCDLGSRSGSQMCAWLCGTELVWSLLRIFAVGLCCGSLRSRRARVYVTHWAKEATNSEIAFFALLGFGQVIGGLAQGKSNLRDPRVLTGIWRLRKSLGLLDFGSQASFAA